MPNNKVVASFDGACEPYNPGGHMGLGWVINGEPQSKYVSASGETATTWRNIWR